MLHLWWVQNNAKLSFNVNGELQFYLTQLANNLNNHENSDDFLNCQLTPIFGDRVECVTEKLT